MDKLSAEVRILVDTHAARREALQGEAARRGLEPAAQPSPPPERVTVFVQFRGSVEPLKDLGLKVLNQTTPIVIGEIAVDRIPALAAHPNVVRIDKPQPPSLRLDDSIPDIRANEVWSRSGDDFTGFSGNGVIVGVVDTGIEYTHRAFRKPDGTSRILAIWDQTRAPAIVGETSPGPLDHPLLGQVALGYGVEYVQTSGDDTVPTINKALASEDPAAVVPHQDTDGHGTHVAGIAAGNGSQDGNCHGAYHYVGVAPEADLIVVRMRGLTPNDPAQTGTELTDAIRYILDRATVGGNVRPTVINLSLGANLGPRDGTGGQEIAIDAILGAYAQGVVIVLGASNEGDTQRHALGTVPGNNTLDLNFQIAPETTRTAGVDVYYTGNNLDAAVRPQGGAFSNFATFTGATVTVNLPGVGTLSIVSATNLVSVRIVPQNNTTRITPTGSWTLRLRDGTNTATPFHAWCDPATFLNLQDPGSTISSNASGGRVIVIGAYSTDGKGSGALAGFSSRGPSLRPATVDPFENTRPHLSAPGVNVTAPAISKFRSDGDDCCKCCCCVDWYRDLDGTSMATPHVTGAVALILEKQNNLSAREVRDILTATARTDAFTGTNTNNDFGFGKLDCKAAVDSVGSSLRSELAAPIRSGRTTARAAREIPRGSSAASMASRADIDILDPAIPLGRFLRTPQGAALYDLGRRHVAEVRALVNTNPRVATVWHRNEGPLIAHHAIRCYLLPHARLPVEVNEKPLREGLERMAAILRRYGSPDLRAAVDLVLPIALALPGKNLEEAITFFQPQGLTAHV
jgi:subtilisin family serine protease